MRHTLTRRHLLLGLCLAGGALASPPARADDFAEISAPIAALDNALIASMQAGPGIPYGRRFDALAPVIDHAFDLQIILQTSVGAARWASLPPEQQAELLTAFRQFTVASYLANFRTYDGQRFEILKSRALDGGQVVPTELVPRVGDPTRIDYVMRQTDQGWRAIDVLLGGTISRVAVQRSDFRALLADGEAPALIASLRRKVADLSASAGP